MLRYSILNVNVSLGLRNSGLPTIDFITLRFGVTGVGSGTG